jgi:small subunit ribosomal protein S18
LRIREKTEKAEKIVRKKACKLCIEKIDRIYYTDEDRLSRFVSDRGKIVPRRITGTCARHQNQIRAAVKRARMLSLLPFTGEHHR